jgi:hypothetical protein
MPPRRINRLASAMVLGLTLIAGCSSGQTVAPTVKPVAFVAPLSATQTPLAIEMQVPVSAESSTSTEPTPNATPIATPKAAPKATPKPTPRPTAKPSSYFKPAGWDGSSDVDCPDFDTHAHAQSFFKGTGGTTSNDPYRLDRDHDGVACERLP